MENEELVTGNISLSLDGRQIDLQMTVPAKPVKARRLLPIFRQITDQFLALSESETEAAGEKISCAKGCAACCRQLIPVAEIEAHQFAETVEDFPEPRRSEIKLRFEKAWRHFAEIDWFGRLAEFGGKSNKDRQEVALDYFYENVSCPFLENETCLIHEERPLGCREYLVTSPAENCWHPTAETVKLMPLPVKPANAVRNISNSENLKGAVNFVPLVLALEWSRRNPDNLPEKTGPEWMADFFRSLTKKEIPSSDE